MLFVTDRAIDKRGIGSVASLLNQKFDVFKHENDPRSVVVHHTQIFLTPLPNDLNWFEFVCTHRWTLQRLAMWMLEELLQAQSRCSRTAGSGASAAENKRGECAASVHHAAVRDTVARALVAQIERQQLFARGLRSILLQNAIAKHIGKSLKNNNLLSHSAEEVTDTPVSRPKPLHQEAPGVEWLARLICASIRLPQPHRASIIDQVHQQLGAPMPFLRFGTIHPYSQAATPQPQQHLQVRKWLLKLINANAIRRDSSALDLSLDQHWRWESKMSHIIESDAQNSLDTSIHRHPLHQPLWSPGPRQPLTIQSEPTKIVSKVRTGRLALRPHDRPEDPLVQLRQSSRPLVSPPPAVVLGVHELDGPSAQGLRETLVMPYTHLTFFGWIKFSI